MCLTWYKHFTSCPQTIFTLVMASRVCVAHSNILTNVPHLTSHKTPRASSPHWCTGALCVCECQLFSVLWLTGAPKNRDLGVNNQGFDEWPNQAVFPSERSWGQLASGAESSNLTQKSSPPAARTSSGGHCLSSFISCNVRAAQGGGVEGWVSHGLGNPNLLFFLLQPLLFPPGVFSLHGTQPIPG